MEERLYELLQVEKERKELAELTAYNERTRERFGLSLSEEEARGLITSRNESLRKYRRIEFGKGILDKLVYMFCDSQYISQDNYAQTLEKLQDIFYYFKNESEDRLSDDELLEFMREQFENVCFGDVEYLAGTCLERFVRGEEVSQEERWSSELYQSILKDIFW